MSGRHSLVALAVGLALAGPAQAQLLISEYLEGSGNNKAVELSNLGSDLVDLSQYRLALYANGKPISESPTNSLALQGTLAPGATLVLANPSASSEILAKANRTSGNLVFNGDDALVLYRGSEIVDSFGQVGVDPGTAWVSGNVSTLDMTLRRKATVTIGRTDATAPFDPAQEYVAAPKDDASGLGCSGDGPCDGTQPPAFVCPVDSLVPVPAIQGPGSSSPLVPAGKFESEQAYATRGVVTQVVSGLYKGFFIQDEQGDGDPATSDGLFVYSTKANAAVVPGAEVCVSGKVKEYFNQTQLNADELVVTRPQGVIPAAVDLLPVAGESLSQLLERHEGMQVRLVPGSSLVVTRNFSFDYDGKRNNLVLAYGAPLIKSTQKFAAMSQEASNWALRNQQNQLVVETDAKAPDGVLPWFPGFNAEDGYLRIGDKLNGLEGALGYSYNLFRLVASNRIDASQIDHSGWDRVETPELAEAGDLRVASFNVLNFFTTVVGGDANPTGSNRGAPTVAEFELQRTKIVSAITRLNADVVGLMEIENNGYGDNSAIANLVAALNAAQPDEADHYRWIAGWQADWHRRHHGGAHLPTRQGDPGGGCWPYRAAGAAGRGGGCQRQAGDHQPGDARVAGTALQLAQGGCAADPGGQPPQVQGLRLLRGLPRLRHCRSAGWPGPLQCAAGLRRQGAGGAPQGSGRGSAAHRRHERLWHGGSHPGADRL